MSLLPFEGTAATSDPTTPELFTKFDPLNKPASPKANIALCVSGATAFKATSLSKNGIQPLVAPE